MTYNSNKNFKSKAFLVLMAIFTVLCLCACSLVAPPGTTPPPTPTPDKPSLVVPEPGELLAEPPAPTFSIATSRHDAIYNIANTSAIYLMMPMAELEERYPQGPTTDNGYISYDDYGFFVKYYKSEKVKQMIVYGSNAWETFNGIKCGSSYDDVVKAYGEPLAVNGTTYSYYSLDNNFLREVPSLATVDINYLYTISFIIENDQVTCIMISKM